MGMKNVIKWVCDQCGAENLTVPHIYSSGTWLVIIESGPYEGGTKQFAFCCRNCATRFLARPIVQD